MNSSDPVISEEEINAWPLWSVDDAVWCGDRHCPLDAENSEIGEFRDREFNLVDLREAVMEHIAIRREREREEEPLPEEAPSIQPCPNGFHWIGQSFTSCDKCGLPIWEHAGVAVPQWQPRSPFDYAPLILRPWKSEDEREAWRSASERWVK